VLPQPDIEAGRIALLTALLNGQLPTDP
jgi:hypothetical protein